MSELSGWDMFVAFMVGAVIGGLVCGGACSQERERSAIRAGVAERVITDQETGVTEFRWIDCRCEACMDRRAPLVRYVQEGK